jgi:ribonuclease VapC
MGPPAVSSLPAAVVIDSSAIVAILRDEPDAIELSARATSYSRRLISAATWLESAIVCESKTLRGGEYFDQIVAKLEIEIVPFTATQAQLARDAFKRYGKGRQSKARLSYGDCFVYALAKEFGAPVLFKGDDFAQTDITAA